MSDHTTLTDGQAREFARALQERQFGQPVRRFVATGEITEELPKSLAIKMSDALLEDDDEGLERIGDLRSYVEAVGFRPPVTGWSTRP